MTHRIIVLLAIFAFGFAACDTELGGEKSDPTVTWPQELSARPGQTLADISLAEFANSGTPGTFSWATPHHSVGDTLGVKHSHRMTFTPDDTAAYSAITKDIAVAVSLIEMVHIHGGTFKMGSPPDEPGRVVATETQFRVTVGDDFYLGKYEVTQKQWETVIGSLPDSVTRKGDNLPMYNVNYYDTLVFCNLLSVMEGLTPAYIIDDETDPEWWGDQDATWETVAIVDGSNGYRLPNEVQWEYACRAGTETPWNSGAAAESDRANPLDDYAWYNAWWHKEDGSAYVAQVQPVGGKKPNKWGLYDMHGNVAEFCWDRFGNYPSYSDPYGVWVTGTNRVIRGGNYSASSTANSLRSAARSGISPATRSAIYGFRVARP